MGILGRRLSVIAVGGLVGAIAIGMLAPTPGILAAGILVLGFGMIVAILFYLIRPVPAADSAPPAEMTSASVYLTGPRTTERSPLLRPSAEVIPFRRGSED